MHAWQGWRGLGCGNGAGRVITHAARYDVSACDVLDEGLDLVFSGGSLYLSKTGLGLYRYWAVVLLTVYLVRCLSHNLIVVRDSGPGNDPESKGSKPEAQWSTCLACVLTTVLVCYEGDWIYVTVADQTVYWCTVAYVSAYLAYHAQHALPACLHYLRGSASAYEEAPVYNLVAGTLQLVAMRLYTGADTPYNPVVLGLLATRTWVKLAESSRRHALTATMDAAYMALLCESYQAPQYLVGLFLGARLVGGVLFRV